MSTPRPTLRNALLIGASLVAAAGVRAELPELKAFTVEWPPYSYAEQGQIKGISTDILRAACQEAALRCQVQLVPWARGYATALSQPNTLVYTTARKPEREALFSWVGPILPRTTWVWVRNEALKRQQGSRVLADYRYGVVRGEASISDLQAAGVLPTSITPDNSNTAVLKLLQNGWVDAMVDTEIGMAWSLKAPSHQNLDVSKLAKLSEEGAYYFALNTKSDPQLAEKLGAAVERLRRSGAIDEIVKHYTQR